ncbi:UNVERIFIED_CONTAM: hypothetical protein GTU68_047816 [Idotea baltica]|nr:hypothetical protein [Idotea baltica]
MAFYPAIAAANEWLDERQSEREEPFVVSGAKWFGGILLGLWDFLRGADLAEVQEATAKAEKAKKAKAKKAKAKAKAKKSKAAAEVEEAADEEWEYEDEAEEEEWEYEDEPEAAAEEDGEEEWEYEDEDEDPEDAEYEEWEEEEWEEGEEWEEEEPEVVIPATKSAKGKKKAAKTEEEKPVEVAKPAFKKPTKASVTKNTQPNYETPQPPAGPWTFPPLDLLAEPEGGRGVEDKALEGLATKLESALNSFRVEAEVISAQVGPAVTMFEMNVPAGTRMNKVTALSQEIAAALKARSVRIIAPIPGRGTIGVEVPNKQRRMVRLRELIHKKAYDKSYMGLPMFIGMDAEGNAVVEDLSKMPHLLIAGTTGSGKSVCINTILSSLLLTRSPHDVQMVLVDPKMVELMTYAKVPHLMMPVVTDAKNATQVLNWLCEKMEGRYELMKDAKVRNIKTYNRLGEEKHRTPRHLPYIVVVIDEMADLMMVSKKEAEGSVTRLLQKSRAAGIHLVVATQRPSTDVITGVLKGNLPVRMAFRVASKIDSRVILDTGGAEKLLGGGDMLYTPPGSSSVNRVQGAFLEDEELDRIVEFVSQESAPNFSQEMVQTATGAGGAGVLNKKTGPDDPLWGEAVRVVLESKRGSASLLQRALQVGYTRASRLIDMMSEEGILGPHIGSKSRQILVTLEEWDAAHEDPLAQGASDE